MKRKVLSIMLVIFMIFFVGCFQQENEKYTYELDLSLLPTEIYQGEVPIESIRIKVVDKKGNISYVSSTKSMYTKKDYELFNQAGTHTITIYYGFFEESFEITILEDNTIDLGVFNSANPYYASAVGLTDEELKESLRDIISVVIKVETYGDLRYDLPKSDVDPNNKDNIMLLYTGKSVNSTWDGGSTWNREHVWPKSLGWFGEDGAGADIHHIRPTNNSANSSRGNKPYGEVEHSESNKKTTSMPGYGSVHYGYATKDYFEPLDNVKGDIARIIFYLMVRYEEADRYTFNTVAQSKEMLLKWNEQDPVDDFEKYRNEQGFIIQGNRTPFIDHPECAELIWGD